MKGSRNLTDQEVELVLTKFKGKTLLRDKLLFLLGLKVGFRISELLSLKVQDVWKHGKPTSTVTVAKRNTKGQVESRTLPVHARVQELLKLYITNQTPDSWLFPSQCGGAITRQMAHKILTEAFDVCQLEGKLGTHTLRKSFARNVYKTTGGDLLKTQKALGHKWLNTTQQYLSVDEDEVFEAILAS